MKEEKESSHKLPPQNMEAEQSVLGGILIENDAINKVMEILTPDDFYRDAHHKIFNSLLDLSESDEPADLITLTNELRNIDQLDSVGRRLLHHFPHRFRSHRCQYRILCPDRQRKGYPSEPDRNRHRNYHPEL